MPVMLGGTGRFNWTTVESTRFECASTVKFQVSLNGVVLVCEPRICPVGWVFPGGRAPRLRTIAEAEPAATANAAVTDSTKIASCGLFIDVLRQVGYFPLS